MGFVEEKEAMIKQGETIKVSCLQKSEYVPDYLEGEAYEIWMNKALLFGEKYLVGSPLYEEYKNAYSSRKNSYGTSSFDDIIAILKTVDKSPIEELKMSSNNLNLTEKIILISHCSKDFEYVERFTKLVDNMRLREFGVQIICSSLDGYGIPNNEKIYSYLKQQFNKDIFVILILSDNYFDSAACMNEMGATWISTENYQAVLIPECEYKKIRGAIDASSVCFKLDDKYRINELRKSLLRFANAYVDDSTWSVRVDEYIIEIEKIKENGKFKVKNHDIVIEGFAPIEETLKINLRYINSEDIIKQCVCFDIELNDKNGKTANVRITANYMSSDVIYGMENKRVEIKIPYGQIDAADDFDFYYIESWSITYKIIRK